MTSTRTPSTSGTGSAGDTMYEEGSPVAGTRHVGLHIRPLTGRQDQ